MKTNFRPTRVAFIDFETQSEAELTTSHKYASHPSTRVLTCVVSIDNKRTRLGPYLSDSDRAFLANVAAERTLVAHNAPFDAAVWELAERLPEATWYDTLPPARAAALPGRLDDLGTLILGRGKDPNGKRLIDLLSKLKPGKPPPAVGPAHQLMLDYNERDVVLLEAVYERVKGFGEPDVMSVDRTINGRGVPVDRGRLLALLAMYEVNRRRLEKDFAESTGDVNPRSAKQVCAWLGQQGFAVDKLNRFAMKQFLADPKDSYFGDDSEYSDNLEAVKEALEQRSEVVRVGASKAEAALLALEDDGRVRDQFVYFGAHTGRWSGRGLQLHNMPIARDVDTRELPYDYGHVQRAAAEASERVKRRVSTADVLNSMLRGMVRAPSLLVADYGAVEARGIAWIADCRRMLTLFSDPDKSVYIDMGQHVFGRTLSKKGDPQEYTLCKTLVLGCGYGMSGAKFGWTCKARTIATGGSDPFKLVKLYREAYPEIPAVWKALHSAVHDAVRGVPCAAGKCELYMAGPDLHVMLPSGRPIVYRNARIEQRVPGYCKLYGMPETPVDTVVFDKPNFGDGFLYGSKLAENVVQGICRDIMAEALVECEKQKLDPCLHVHDEMMCASGEDRLPEFMRIMSTPPTWAPGFPVLAEGYAGPVWSKQTKGYRELNAIDGRLIK